MALQAALNAACASYRHSGGAEHEWKQFYDEIHQDHPVTSPKSDIAQEGPLEPIVTLLRQMALCDDRVQVGHLPELPTSFSCYR